MVFQQEEKTNNGDKSVPDKETIRAEWVEMRQGFHQLLSEIPEGKWRHRSRGTRWTIAEICAHIVHDVEGVQLYVKHARQGKNFLKLPSFIIHPINWLLTKIIGLRATPASLTEKFDKNYDEALRLLDGIQDDEWHQGAHFFDAGFWSIAYIFQQTPQHFAEHAAQVRESILKGKNA